MVDNNGHVIDTCVYVDASPLLLFSPSLSFRLTNPVVNSVESFWQRGRLEQLCCIMWAFPTLTLMLFVT